MNALGYLPYAVLVFGLIVLIGIVKTKTPGWGPATTRMAGLTLVTVLAVFLALVSSGMKDMPANEVTAAFSILGAVAGYLFGVQGKDSSS